MTMLEKIQGVDWYPRSFVDQDGLDLGLGRTGAGKRLFVRGAREAIEKAGFQGVSEGGAGATVLAAPLSAHNALAVRRLLRWLVPQPLGLRTSAGCGDRLGLATPGHVRAARACGASEIGMVFAQQSVRENARTGRTPQEVIDDATWGVLQEGWRGLIGADADHLKTPADADAMAAAGFTFFTIDPGEHVDGSADTDDAATLRRKFEALPWAALETSAAALRSAYPAGAISLEGLGFSLNDEILTRAAVKYGRAVAHVAAMYRHLRGLHTAEAFELEVSVDETDTPTSHAEHYYIASELKRLGVRWVSLAPRYVGAFEKGVDYIGDLREFERSFAGHAAIARALGPYKLSLHSGSDKFSIYGIAAEHARGLLHLKTAGTSYLEALRATAQFDPGLFREILAFACERYSTEQASYHVSARLDRVPDASVLTDDALPSLLEQFDARQVLHVAYGSVLATYRERFFAGLAANEELHYGVLERHFIRHLRPLIRG